MQPRHQIDMKDTEIQDFYPKKHFMAASSKSDKSDDFYIYPVRLGSWTGPETHYKSNRDHKVFRT